MTFKISDSTDDPVTEVTQNPGPETQGTQGKHIEVALGGAVQLQCPENTAGCWSRVGTGERLEAVGPGPGLALEDVLYQDAGEYRCLARRKGTHDKWRSEINVDLTVKGKQILCRQSIRSVPRIPRPQHFQSKKVLIMSWRRKQNINEAKPIEGRKSIPISDKSLEERRDPAFTLMTA